MIDEKKTSRAERLQKADFLRFQSAEIEKTNILDPEEEETAIREARGLAGEIAANGPLGVQALKRLVNACYEADLASSLELARALRHPLDHTQDMLEGVRAFEEKRAPRFEGR